LQQREGGVDEAVVDASENLGETGGQCVALILFDHRSADPQGREDGGGDRGLNVTQIPNRVVFARRQQRRRESFTRSRLS
jgi:hypothetical protein